MFTIVNKDNIYAAGYFGLCKEYRIHEIGDERALIKYLAQGYIEVDKNFIYNPTFNEEYFDGYGRHINPFMYQDDAYSFYIEHIKPLGKNNKKYNIKNKIYYGAYRKDPVPYTGACWRSRPSIRSRKVKHIAAIYANPEYKDFNRGSRADFPLENWDDWRSVERCWKSQSKSKHQWKEKKR